MIPPQGGPDSTATAMHGGVSRRCQPSGGQPPTNSPAWPRDARLATQPLSRQKLLLDRSLHLAIADMAGNRRLRDMLGQAFERLILKRRIEGLPSRGMITVQEHAASRNESPSSNRTAGRRIMICIPRIRARFRRRMAGKGGRTVAACL